MRIRKNASKILGSASTLFSSYSPSPSKISSTSDIIANYYSSELSICELNCSPWDLNLIDSNNFNFNSVENSKEEKECIKIKETATDSTNEKNKKFEEKKNIRYCTKRGKGWDCKKPAQFSHSFCEYHLEKLQASMSRMIRKTSKIGKNGAVHNKPTKLEASSESNSYYYYSGFRPWQGKRRVRADVEVKEEEVADSDKDKDDDNDDNDQVIGEKRADVGITYCKKTDGKEWHCKRPVQFPHLALCSHHLAQSQSYNSNYSNRVARCKIKRTKKKVVLDLKSNEDESEADVFGNVDVAGDDEYDSYGVFDCDGEDIDDDDDDETIEHVNEGEVKKRRKPMKARSLKSLL